MRRKVDTVHCRVQKARQGVLWGMMVVVTRMEQASSTLDSTPTRRCKKFGSCVSCQRMKLLARYVDVKHYPCDNTAVTCYKGLAACLY